MYTYRSHKHEMIVPLFLFDGTFGFFLCYTSLPMVYTDLKQWGLSQRKSIRIVKHFEVFFLYILYNRLKNLLTYILSSVKRIFKLLINASLEALSNSPTINWNISINFKMRKYSKEFTHNSRFCWYSCQWSKFGINEQKK